MLLNWYIFNIKSEVSKLDTFLNIDQSLQLRGLAKLSKTQLKVALAGNEELKRIKSTLNSKLDQVNKQLLIQNKHQLELLEGQRLMLQNQIKQIEKKQILDFHRKRIFEIKEYIIDYEGLTDEEVIKYLQDRFFPSCLDLLNESKLILSDLPDKDYCHKLIRKIHSILDDGADASLEDFIAMENISKEIYRLKVEEKFLIEVKESSRKEINRLNTEFGYPESYTNSIHARELRKSDRRPTLLLGISIVIFLFYLVGLANSSESVDESKSGNWIGILFFIGLIGILYYKSKKKVGAKNYNANIENSKEDFVRRAKIGAKFGIAAPPSKQQLQEIFEENSEKLADAQLNLGSVKSELDKYHFELKERMAIYLRDHVQVNKVLYAYPEFMQP